METYVLLKHLHVSCAAISFIGFFLRGLGKVRHAPIMQRLWVKIVPHIVDTALLASAIAMVVMSEQYPTTTPWIMAKIIGLLVYIALGTVTIKLAVSDRVRLIGWLAAMATFIYIVGIAVTRDPLSFFS